ncbi:hypothetical protein NEMBOFW57_007076 [Staphylotrichum longicolle]|uniref:Methyltransferase n=1 Tax=Staphylotrichum longicolle TaxID=669026 RepID=A0AAD4EU46_9PEZI|nr:hypothetical protein NEMBOFW57_007076 [Staphylotrichum longicolle]
MMVSATLHFLSNLERYDSEKPYFLNIAGNESSPAIIQNNLEYAPQDGIELLDMRERGFDAFSLEDNGFTVLKYEAAARPEDSDAAMESYCDEIVRLVMKECNAVHTICYDYRVLDYEAGQDTGRKAVAPPVFPAHIDHTVDGGPRRIRRHLTEEEAETYLNDKFRARIINVWRPLNGVVEDCPIAICDPRSVDAQRDLVAADRVTPNFAVELYYLRYNPKQTWYWVPDQTPDELTRIADSEE